MAGSERKTQFVIVLPASQRSFIAAAAKRAGAPSLSAFIRDAVLEKSRSVLGGDADLPIVTAGARRSPVEILDAVVDVAPADLSAPHAVFPGLHAFAAHLSDRNRAILRWIGTHEAESIHELSRRFDYSYAGLSRTLGSLAALGIVGHGTGTDARCQPPRLLCHRIRLHLPFHDHALAQPRILRVSLGDACATTADIACPSMDDFSTVVTDRGYTLLRLIAAHNPMTVGALGKLTGTTSQNAYPVLRRLAKFGLVRMEGGSRKKKPVLLYDGLIANIDLLA
jgi:predicted transcriptional regulator